MTRLRQMMLEELQRRNYSAATIAHYIRWVEQYASFFGKSPDKLGLEHLRTYQAYLLTTRKLCASSVENHVAALRFLYVRTLKRYEFREFIPYPRVRKQLPGILSKEEVARMINASGSLTRFRSPAQTPAYALNSETILAPMPSTLPETLFNPHRSQWPFTASAAYASAFLLVSLSKTPRIPLRGSPQ